MFGLLAVVSVSNMGLALAAACGVAAVAVGILVVRANAVVEHRRRAAIDAASLLRGHGLTILPNLLTDYAVGDYSGLATRLRDTVHQLTNPAQLEVEFAKVFNDLVDAQLKDPQKRPAFLTLVQKKAAAFAPAPPPAAS